MLWFYEDSAIIFKCPNLWEKIECRQNTSNMSSPVLCYRKKHHTNISITTKLTLFCTEKAWVWLLQKQANSTEELEIKDLEDSKQIIPFFNLCHYPIYFLHNFYFVSFMSFIFCLPLLEYNCLAHWRLKTPSTAWHKVDSNKYLLKWIKNEMNNWINKNKTGINYFKINIKYLSKV